jgi:hypothetical protein
MYRPNDVLMNRERMSNVINTQDEDWHAKYIKPIRGFWSMTKVLDVEPLVDETLVKFTDKLDNRFAKGDEVCMMDDWLGYCTLYSGLSSEKE